MLNGMKGWFVLSAALLLAGCSNQPAGLTAAPLGDRAVLERLAESYTTISDKKLAVSPASLGGPERRKFIEQVFAESGYSYRETLRQMAANGIDKSNPLHVDMAELVLMSHRRPAQPVELTDIYNGEELQDVAALERQLNQ